MNDRPPEISIAAPALHSRGWGPCPLCRTDNSDALFVKASYRYVRCRRCGFVFVNPMPSAGDLEAIYQDPRYFANRNEWAYGYNDYVGERALHEPLFARRVEECERALGVHDGRGLRLLDVGCAAGFLLEAARARGWEIAGVEIAESATAVANERLAGAVRRGTLRAAQLDDASFDCVVMLDIVEHVADPVGLLREAARVLKPGGVLLLSAPNVRSLSARLLGRRWFHFKRDHVVLFSPETLVRALDAAGLDCLRLQRNGKLVTLAYLFGRLKVYAPLAGRMLLTTVGRWRLAQRLFYDSWTGELLAFCRKRDESGRTRPSCEEVYGWMRAHQWPPTALWRAAEYFRLAERDWEPPVLDLGCGDGHFARRLFPHRTRAGVVGVDRDTDRLRPPVLWETEARVVGGEAEVLPFRSGTFRTILANCVLEHVERLDPALAEIARVLQPGGRLIFTVPSEHFGSLLFVASLFQRIGLGVVAGAYAAVVNRLLGHRYLLTPDEWRRRLEAAGLRVERVEYFIPGPLARVWDRRLWRGAPAFLFNRLTRAGRRRKPRPVRLPPSWNTSLSDPTDKGAGAVYVCVRNETAST
jgi:2-polyprenyl-3-methyl-5-hydroxy-6-metoxy-1,4-benzoquinol methylase